MNRVNLLGRITKDIELKETQTGVKFVRFGIAVNRNFKNEDRVNKNATDVFSVVFLCIICENRTKE